MCLSSGSITLRQNADWVKDTIRYEVAQAERLTSAEVGRAQARQAQMFEASRQFFREQYPSIYRYLLWLTDRPEAAEDLAQETFVRAWRHLNTFDERGSLFAI